MSAAAPVWLAVSLALAAVAYAALSWWRGRERTDLLYAAATLAWVVLALTDLRTAAGGAEPAGSFTRLAYQLLIAAVSALLLHGVHSLRGWPRRLMVLQAAAGAALALGDGQPARWQAWIWVNAFCSLLLVAWLAWRTHRSGRPTAWMVLLVAICGLGVMLTDMHEAGGGRLQVSELHFFYLPMLLALWRALRAGAAAGPAPGDASEERQRLAQEVHDGVGSHLTTLISALDMGTPQERITASALRECLAELKLLVDGADQSASALALLASLRYRMQPLLEAAGIALHWQVADEETLEQVVGPPAREMLRIAQESLANAVRHSGASEVVVTVCRQRARHLVMLEVADNGRGLPPEAPASSRLTAARGSGRGLPGMRQRAQRLGGELCIDAAPGGGTRVTLLVPLQRLRQPARAGAA